jgi:hypothetical protein
MKPSLVTSDTSTFVVAGKTYLNMDNPAIRDCRIFDESTFVKVRGGSFSCDGVDRGGITDDNNDSDL